MRRAEVRERFDEIVAFAEVERFLDTPLKRYSSGMAMRLAFAVAAHLDPEILVIDEVLAVGDAAFQKKCLSRLNDIAKGHRTVLFVSHSMGTVTRLCRRAIGILIKAELRMTVPPPRSSRSTWPAIRDAEFMLNFHRTRRRTPRSSA